MLPPDYFPARTARDQSLNLTIWIARPQTMFCLTATLRQKLIKCLLLPHSNPLVNTCILQPGRADVWIWSHAMLTLEWPTNLIKFKKKKKKKLPYKDIESETACLFWENIFFCLLYDFRLWGTHTAGRIWRYVSLFYGWLGNNGARGISSLFASHQVISWPVNNFVVTTHSGPVRLLCFEFPFVLVFELPKSGKLHLLGFTQKKKNNWTSCGLQVCCQTIFRPQFDLLRHLTSFWVGACEL